MNSLLLFFTLQVSRGNVKYYWGLTEMYGYVLSLNWQERVFGQSNRNPPFPFHFISLSSSFSFEEKSRVGKRDGSWKKYANREFWIFLRPSWPSIICSGVLSTGSEARKGFYIQLLWPNFALISIITCKILVFFQLDKTVFIVLQHTSSGFASNRGLRDILFWRIAMHWSVIIRQN